MDVPNEIYDVVGIGFGPANLALLTAIEEEGIAVHGRPLKRLCLERKPGFCWHPGMLLTGAEIQLSFLKDLVTLRNPSSRYSFLNYLQEKGRLDRFINRRKFFPSRVEFNDYYSWVASFMEDHVRYGTEVLGVQPVASEDGESTDLLQVKARDVESGEPIEVLARNIVVATGGLPNVPRGIGIRSSPRCFHSNDFLHRIHKDFPDPEASPRFVVVGSGQSAAELFEYLYEHYPNAEVVAAIRRFAYQPADDSHFVNEIFFPKMEDFLFDLPAERRRMVIDAHRDTNYSAVDMDLIEGIYEHLYQREVIGDERVRIEPFLELRKVTDEADETVLEFVDVAYDKVRQLRCDGAVLATGYRRPKRHPLIDHISQFLESNGADGFQVDRYFRVQAKEGFHPGIFLQGFCEDTHGLSDTLLSTLPTRSYNIMKSLSVPPTPTAQTPAVAEEVALGV